MSLLLALLACASGPTPYAWDLPANFPQPSVPEDNPMTEEAVELGRRLFYDPQLSVDEEMSCASCHQQELAFTDGRAQGQGTTGELHPRGPMSLANVGYASRLTWVNPHVDRLEDQALLPLFGDAPVEMGMTDREDELLSRLSADPVAAPLFEAAWPEEADPVTLEHLTQAIASFQRTLISGDSPYDRYMSGDRDALSADAQAGMTLFFSERLECFHCHGSFNFSDAVDHEGLASAEVAFHNTGLYNVDGQGAYPADAAGLFAFTSEPGDMGRFRAPTLRNIALTAPYFHDGSAETLDDVIDHYAAGGRTIEEGPNAGDGSESPYKSAFVAGFILTDAERVQLKAFLEALTDEGFVSDPRFSDPFAAI
ncbi:MAG: di-heme enzyme [Alphaproteobacteria bacterium]|nr:di-heme enzyme [Alphaproteobacteria bacterium]